MSADDLVLGKARGVAQRLRSRGTYVDSRRYWENRYAAGGNSGGGSYGAVAEYKARFLNRLAEQRGVRSVLEFGCGDGNQLTLARYPRYVGLDVSRTAITMCASRFSEDKTKSFLWYDPERFVNNGALTADLTLSLDVILHLVEDDLFERYMTHLFQASRGLVAIFSPDVERQVAAHVRYRAFTSWVAAQQRDWVLAAHEPNTLGAEGYDTAAEFFVYART